MKRALALAVAVVAMTSCSGFKSLERGDWVLAWSDDVVKKEMVNGTAIEVVKPAPGARQVLIPLDRYEAELTEGKRRKVVGTFNTTPRLATEVKEPIQMVVGEVRELRVPEQQEAQASFTGEAVKVYWTNVNTVDEWKNSQPVEHKESTLYLLADEPGAAKLKVITAGSKEPHLIDVVVRGK